MTSSVPTSVPIRERPDRETRSVLVLRSIPEVLESVEGFRHPSSSLRTRGSKRGEHSFSAMLRVAEFLAVPRSDLTSTEHPFFVDALVRVPICERHVEPVVGIRHMVVSSAVHDPSCARVIVEVDEVVADEVHGAVEPAKGPIIEPADSLAPGSEPTVVDVLDKQRRNAVEVLGIHRHGVAERELADLIPGDDLVELVHVGDQRSDRPPVVSSGRAATMPPSTRTSEPVMNDARSDVRKSAT